MNRMRENSFLGFDESYTKELQKSIRPEFMGAKLVRESVQGLRKR